MRLARAAAAGAAAVVVLWAPPAAQALPAGTHVERYRGGLDFPVDMAWVPGGRRLFFTEKNTGRVRVLVGGRLLARPCVDLAVRSDGERGALGIALHPRFRRNHYLYVYFTRAAPVENRVVRFTVRANRCTAARPILTGIPSTSGYHNGGQLLFTGPRRLLVSTGEGHDPTLAQRLGSRLGKILRIRPDGRAPLTNPFVVGGRRSPVWSYGHRNVFGLARKPRGRAVVATENGPGCDDELNRIRKGRNYGWGDGYACGTAGLGASPQAPLRRWNPTIAPTDPWWYRGRIQRLNGSLLVGDFNTGRLRRLELDPTGSRVVRGRTMHRAGDAIVDVSEGPGGWVYYATPNAIYRIVPRR
jgi:aldose sugar dehydrogenase